MYVAENLARHAHQADAQRMFVPIQMHRYCVIMSRDRGRSRAPARKNTSRPRGKLYDGVWMKFHPLRQLASSRDDAASVSSKESTYGQGKQSRQEGSQEAQESQEEVTSPRFSPGKAHEVRNDRTRGPNAGSGPLLSFAVVQRAWQDQHDLHRRPRRQAGERVQREGGLTSWPWR